MKLFKSKAMQKKVFTLMAVIFLVGMMAVPCFASGGSSGNVSGVMEQKWDADKGRISVGVRNVVVPDMSAILAIAFVDQAPRSLVDDRKHGQFEWGRPCFLFVCLLFCLIAPQFIWKIV